MASPTTILRRTNKEQWLRDNPNHHEWLRRQAGKLSDWCKEPAAADMISSLKRAGLYARQTVAIDICAAMRRLAVSFAPSSPPPSQRAAAEIEVILARDGVDREQVLKQLLP